MSSFVIKLIAIYAMLCDHFNDAIIGHFTFLNVIGRLAFPLFAFQIVIGYKNTSNIKKYLLRLIIFAIISQIPFQIFMKNTMGIFELNVFFTLFGGLVSLIIMDTNFLKNKMGNMIVKILLVILICVLAEILKCDYGAVGILTILLINFTYPCDFKKNNNKKINNKIDYKKLILLLLGAIILALIEYKDTIKNVDFKISIQIIVATIIPIFIMITYNGKKGKSLKYFFYAFYPIHLIILDIMNYYLYLK